MLLRTLFLGFLGLCFGGLTSGGIVTILISVGLVPRFAGKTHTNKKVFFFEEMICLGTIGGGILSVFEPYLVWQMNVNEISAFAATAWSFCGNIFVSIYGVFAGIFVGCLALAIAEMLDSIPIFARRFSFRHGLGIAVLAIALGKMTGSLLYFYLGFYHTSIG